MHLVTSVVVEAATNLLVAKFRGVVDLKQDLLFVIQNRSQWLEITQKSLISHFSFSILLGVFLVILRMRLFLVIFQPL